MKTVPIIKTCLKIQDFVTSKKRTKLSKAKVNKEVQTALKYLSAAHSLVGHVEKIRMHRKANKILVNVMKKIEKENSLLPKI